MDLDRIFDSRRALEEDGVPGRGPVAVALLLAAACLTPPIVASGAAGVATASVTMIVDVATGHRGISSLIYGINDDKVLDPHFAATLAETRAGLLRLGGNRWTAYNWVNNASNAGSDYEFENDNFLTPSTVPGAAVLPNVVAAQTSGAAAIVTVPINGYVSADESPPGPVMNSGPNYLQTRFKVEIPTDPHPLTTKPDPAAPNVYENQFAYWLMKSAPKARVIFELDNEPDLWAFTHKEVHPKPITYAELLQKDLEYAAAIKKVWPSALVSGPVSYGWEGYETLQNAPDAAKDGNFLDWYLKAVAKANAAAHTTLVNYLDLHWYPEATDPAGTRITGTDVTPAEVIAREQAPRSLWDPTYVEDSWITKYSTGGKPIELIPRVDGQIAANDRGAGLALTEWNYGGGQSISGAVASADVLGIFGRYGVNAAAWWPLNPDESYSLAAFAAFRNYDGHGSAFGDTEVSASTSDRVNTSIYGSIDANNPHRSVIVAINKNSVATATKLEITGGYPTARAAVYTLTGAGAKLMPQAELSAASPGVFGYTMPSQSVSVIVPVYGATSSARYETQVFVHRPDRGGTLAHCGGTAFGRPGAYVADCEKTGMIGLIGQRRPPEYLPAPVEVFLRECAVGEDKAIAVECRATRQPRRLRLGTDKREERRTWQSLVASRSRDSHFA